MREVLRLQVLLVLIFLHTALAARRIRYGRAQTYDRPPDFGGQEFTITVYPQEQEVHEGQDAVFDCRARTADGTVYPEVRWSRVGEPLPPRAYESTGRLTIRPVHQSDSGTYVCTATHMGTMKDAHVQLNVLPSIAQEMQGGLSLSGLCRADERACGNNECVKADYVCDGEPDCRDRSDEQNCPSLRQCEPNEFKCNNGRCVQKMWLCDGDDDCGDNSDEQQCRQKASSDGCGPTEFRCRDGRQCVLSSFHCDGTNDCQDGSDEVGCVQPTVVEAPETNKQVPAGGTFQLTCRAVAVPEPYINWRLNWGPVCDPPRCVQHSEGGLGTLTVNNAQPLDQGAYTCEAINVKGRVLATPDCIVRIVNIPAPSYEPRPPAQVQCDIAGSVNLQPGYGGQCQCKGLVTGPSCNQCVPGSYHLHDKAPQGCLKCFCFGITDQCRSSTWYRSKDKLTFNGDPQGVALTDFDERDTEQNGRFDYIYPGMITYSNGRYGESVKYWRMPQRFLGNKLSSYGGELAFDMQHSCSGSLITEPLVVIKGNRITLVHRPRNGVRSIADRTERVTIDTYENNYEHEDGRPASREDLMMVLADLESFLIRATHCDGQRSTSLGDVSWEIAVDRDTQDRLAVEVEQCSCPPGYTGLSCEDCAPGYERSGQGPYLGTCVPARQGPQCSAAGAISTQPSYAGTCQCKTYATGPLCDQCPPNSFYMSAENPHGCIPCFCSGVTQQCSSSGYSRVVVEINYPQGTRDQLEVTTSDAHTPFQPQSRPQLTGRDITFSTFYETPGQTLYWKMPTPFLGNKVTSYGGTLKYVFRYSGTGPLNGDPDVILRGNDITLYFKNRQPTHPERDNTVEVKLFEDHWHRVDGQQATREHLLMTLADLDALLIKMNYLDDCSSSSLISVSLEHAEPRHTGGQIAYEVEQCVCPPGYIGTSCEDCAPGYSRTGGGLYLGLCERCECHGHATQCDKEHGFCVDCQHNTEGDQCERCKPGFMGDPRRGTPHDCQPAATRPPCNCNNHSPRGCDSFGRCLMCEHNTEGYHCEQCKKGFYGDATRGTPFDCTPCPCPATSDCFLDAYGQVQCRNCPAGFSGRLCDECAPGYTRSRTHGGRDCEPIGRVGPSDVVFVPTPEARAPSCELHEGDKPSMDCLQSGIAPLRVQIDPPKNLQVPRGGRAQWYCHIVGHSGPNLRLEWTKVGTNTLPDSAVQTNGQLVIEDVRESDSGQYRCTATGPHQFATDDATLIVTKPQPNTPIVSPPSQSVDVGVPARFECSVPGNDDAELHWRREDGSSLGYGVTDEHGVLTFTNVQPSDAGAYVCSAVATEGEGAIDSSPAYLSINPTEPKSTPIVEITTQTVDEGTTVTFHCHPPSDASGVELHWRRQDETSLSYEATDEDGILTIANVRLTDAGTYICFTEDPETGNRIDSAPASLIVNPITPSSEIQPTPVVENATQTIEEGGEVILKCKIPNREDIGLHWRREDDEKLPSEATVDGGILRISNIQESDGGSYICYTEDEDTGERVDSAPAHISVIPSEPKAERKPLADTTIVSIQEGGTVKLHCTISDKESDELHWRREDGGFLPYDAVDSYGVLTIQQAQLSDSGIYICYSEDSITGERIDSTPTKLEVIPVATSEIQRVPVVETPTVTVEQGETIRLRCNIPTKADDIQLHWRREDGRALRWDISEDYGLLIISNVQPSDAGAYICSAEDMETGETIDSAPAYITVNPSALKGVTPHVESTAQSFEEGETITLRCTLPDKANAELHWRREDGNSLGYDATDEDGILTMTNVKPADSGAYICSAEDHETGERVDSVAAYITITPRTTKAPLIENPVETVGEGGAVRLLCHVPDNEETEVHWRREDGNPLGYGASEEDGALIIPHAQLSDSGAYICSVEDPDGNQIDLSRAYLTVHASTSAPKGGLATPLLDTTSQIIQEGDTVTFRCTLPSLRNAHIHWRRQDGSSFGYDVTDEDGILTIPRVESADAGAYICTVEDPETGESVESAPAYLTVNPSTPRQPEVDPPTQSVDEGETVAFRCSVPGVDDAVIHWRREDGSPLGYGVTDEDGVLTIPRAEPSDAGTYVCWNDDPRGGAPIESQPAYLTVNPAPLKSPEVEPPEQTVQQGDTVTFRCNVPGDPDAELHWRKEDGEQFRNEITDDEGVLTITDVQPSDAGAYICTADDPDGPIESPLVYLIVNSRTSNHRPVVNTEREVVNEGENVVLRCEMPTKIDGVQLHWRREDGAEFGYGTTDENGVLTIQRVQQSDAGAYICSAEPQNGGTRQDSPITYLIVNPNSPKSPIVDASSDSVNEGAPVRFRCYVPGASGAQLEWRREDGNALNDKATDENGILTIMQTKASDAGAYVCSAKSPDGGRPVDSSPIHLNVVPTPPRAPIVLSAEETVDEGSPIRLRCYLPGSRDAELHWRREDGNPLGKDATDEQGILTIPRARTSDAGAYICSAKEPESIESLDSQPARINVNAMELPTLVVETSSDSVSEGQAVRLQCHAPGRPDVELHWRREDGASLSSSATEQRGILTIMQTQPSDSGTYICSTGQPGDDNVIDSSPVHLTVTRRLPQTPVVDASSESVTEGQPVRLQCHVPGRPDLELKWRRDDDKPLSSSAVEQRGTLTIMRTETSDSGAYICSTVVTNGENAIHSSPIHLTVASSKPKGPLLVTTEETVNEGDLVRLRCYLPGQSDNGLHWRRQDGNALSEDTTDEHGILTIPRASPSDSGYYICSFGHPPVDSPPARITVNAVTPGVPVVEPLSVSISVGHAARFRCYVPGNPRAELHWRKQDGRELGIGITETQGYLSISRAQQSDAGAYVCSAQSSPGGSTVDSQPVSLTVNPIAPTKPVVNPPTQTIDEGGSARYQCYVPGNPGARLNWRREDGVALGYDVTDNNGILTITNARISDAGAYICSATDQQTGSAAVSSPVYLSVNQNRPVNPVVDPQSQTVDEGASARFRCHVPGNPDAQLRWRKEDGSAFGYGVTDSQGVLSFARVAPSDAGAYICTAQGPRGVSPIHSSPAYLGVNPRRPSNPVVEPPTQTISEGDPAKFRCYLPGVPDAQLSWRKQDGSSLGHTVTDSRGLLSFPRVQPSDAGAYVCTAQDQRGGSPTDSPPAYLNVNPRRPGSTPTLMIDPPSQTVNENEPATFKCWVPGVLACELTWHKEYIGGPLPYGVYQSGGTLKIPRAQLHDAGNYICTASNQYGIGQSPPGKLTVIRPPQPPRVDPPEMTVNDGDPARFRCWVPGDPAARLSWRMRSGEPIPYGAQENEGILNFPRARHSHAGGYVCTATDPDGRNPPIQSPEVRLNIKQPKTPMVEPISQTVKEGDSVKFRCWLPGSEDAEIHWSRVDGNPLGYGVSEDQNGTLSIPVVHEADIGEYICSALDPESERSSDSIAVRLDVTKLQRPEVDPPEQIVNEGDPVRFHCRVRGNADAQIRWSREDGEPLPHGVSANGNGMLYIPNVRLTDAGNYVCSTIDPERGEPTESTSARLIVHAPESEHDILQVEPQEQTVEEDNSAQIICKLNGQSTNTLKWHKEDGNLSNNTKQINGVLTIENIQRSDAGNYICMMVDEITGRIMHSQAARINVELTITPQIDPYEQTVSENEPSRIRCWVPGNPSATLKWRKHGANLPEEAEDRGGVLLIPRTTLHDAGNYICSAQISPGGPSVDAPPALINVRRPEAPRYEPPVRAEKPSERPIVDPPEQTVNEGEPVRFRCYVPNEQSARVRWSYGRPDGPLPPYVQDDRGLLTIRRADSTHSGEYFCTYDAPEGALHSAPARLRVNKPGGPPRPEASPADQTVQTGERARFHCDANSQTPARIRWGYRAPDGPLRGDVVQEGDDVVINSADESNAGEYICTATNEYGTGEAAPVRLHVTENEEPPTARVVPRVWNGKPGDRHQFRCITTGVPPPQVTWTGPDGAQLPDDVNDIGGGVLDFSNGRADLNGDYTCTAVNIVGEASDHGSVNIGPSLTVRTTPPGPKIVLTAGEPLEVKCEAFGEPEPEVEWLHDPGPERGDLPDDFKPVTISEQFIRHPSIGIGNAGVYTCKGSNSQATATKDIHVEVVEASRVATVAILGGSTQWLEPGSPTEIICAATGNSIIDRIQWVKTDGDLPPDVEDHNEPGILHFANFKSSDSGVYECRGYRNDEQIASAQVTIHPTNGGPLGAARVEIDEPNIRVVNHGDSIVLKCSVHEVDQQHRITWIHARDALRKTPQTAGYGSILHLHTVDPAHQGPYWVVVEFPSGERLYSRPAYVIVRPRSMSDAQIVKFDEKSEATITCPVYAVPGAEVTWEKQDGSLPDDAVTSRNKLLIQEFNDAATGTYICRVSVEGQEIEGYVTALIYVPDTIIQVLLEASSESVALGDRAWFDCKVAGDPDAVITWSREGEEDLPDNAQVTGNRLLFVNVREDNGGIYKCHAETKEGPLETRTVLNVGSTKRKRKHLHRNLKPSLRMHRNVPQKKKRQQSVFGSWFTSV